MKATLATSLCRAASARTQVAYSFIVALRLGDGLGMQTLLPLGFCCSVCSTPCAKPLQKLIRAKFVRLVGLAVQASARSPAVLMLILTGGVFVCGAGAAIADDAQKRAKGGMN